MNRAPKDLAVSRKYQRQLEQAEKRHHNRMFDEIIMPCLYDPDNDIRVSFFDQKKGNFSQEALERLIQNAPDDAPASILPNAQLMANPLKFAIRNSSGWDSPTECMTNAGFQIVTFEYDGEGSEALEQQLAWFSGKPETCPFHRVHQALSRYQDYRGYCVVFSGNKSLHIHIIFDTKHLSKELAASDKGAKEIWSVDVPVSALAPMHRIVWREVAAIIKGNLDIDLEFDANLSNYFAKRRGPWGTRIIDKADNVHGFDIGDQVTQTVVQERILSRSSPKVDDVMFSASKADMAIQQIRTSRNQSSAKPVMEQEEQELLEEIIDYLKECGWPEYPKPVVLKHQETHNALYFQNHETDQHPNTFVFGGYPMVVPAGKGAPSDLFPLPNNQTLDETIEICRQRLAAKKGQVTATPKPTKVRPQSWPKAYAHKATSIDKARRTQDKMLSHLPNLDGTTLIQGLPGSGKTHALMSHIQERRWDDDAERYVNGRELSRGFIGIACPSYGQALSKLREYTSLYTGNTCAVLLYALSKIYERSCRALKTEQLDRLAIGQAGYSDPLAGIRALQPDVFDEMFKRRDAMWIENGKSLFHPNHTILFMTHELIKHWPQSRLSKAFLHPDFPKDYTDEDIERCCREMSLYRLIYDEVTTDDLVSIDSASIVKITRDMNKHHERANGKPWDEGSIITQANAYDHVISGYPNLKLGFDKCNRIIRTKYRKKKDRYSVDAKRHPFGKGIDDKNFYAQRHGIEYYCKPMTWWHSLGCPTIILTTEDMPTEVFKNIDHGKHKTRCLRLMNTPHLFQEHVPVIFDERARIPRYDRKSDCRSLASELLNGAAQFVIGNKLEDINPPLPSPTCSHISAKGRNDLKDKEIATIITYPALEQYDKLAILGSAFDIKNPIQLAYRDTVVQDIGRNLGFRRQLNAAPVPHKVYIKPSLYRDLNRFEVGSDIPFHFYNRAA